MSKSPCIDCQRFKWCENKQCQRWYDWFIQEWKKFNDYYNNHNPMIEIVYCKDCEHYVVDNEKTVSYCKLYGAIVSGNYFCELGKRREGE